MGVAAEQTTLGAAFTRQEWAVLLDTDPPAALTHVPLRRRPIPAVNIHGHLHDGDEPPRRHVNVSVERTGYEPARLDRVLAQAASRCAAGNRRAPQRPRDI